MSGRSPMMALKPRGLSDTMRLATIGDFQAYGCAAVDGERSRPCLSGGADATLVTAASVHHAAHQGSTMGDLG